MILTTNVPVYIWVSKMFSLQTTEAVPSRGGMPIPTSSVKVKVLYIIHSGNFSLQFNFTYSTTTAINITLQWLTVVNNAVFSSVNPLISTLNRTATDHYTVTQWLVHWPLMGGLLHLVQVGGAWVGCSPAQSPPCCTKCNSPPIKGQSNNFILFDVAL